MRLRTSRLARRAWQTLWKPVPELINILGVEVPDAPCVVLAGIRSDAATLNWTHPAANRPVKKFLIQVNGVNGTISRAINCPLTWPNEHISNLFSELGSG